MEYNNLFYQFQAIFTSRVSSENHSVGYSLSSTLASCFDDMQLWNRTAGIGGHRISIRCSHGKGRGQERREEEGREGKRTGEECSEEEREEEEREETRE